MVYTGQRCGFRPFRGAASPVAPSLADIWGRRAIWLWDVRQTGLTIEQIAQQVRAVGYDAIYVKASNGGNRWAHQWNTEAVQAFESAGLTVCAWHYNAGWYRDPEHPDWYLGVDAEADALDWAYNVAQCPQIFDVEYEYLATAQHTPYAAEEFSAQVHSLIPELGKDRLAYAPDFRIAAHNRWYEDRTVYRDGGGFPWQPFNELCSVVMPQLYVRSFQWTIDDGLGLADAWQAQFPGPTILPIWDRLTGLNVALNQGYPSGSLWKFG